MVETSFGDAPYACERRIKGAVAYGVDRGRMPASAMTESAWSLLDKFGYPIFDSFLGKLGYWR